MIVPKTGLAQFITDLAKQHNIVYAKTYGDEWAETVTKLSGDDVAADGIECLAIALKRAGVISGEEMGWLLINYLREQMPSEKGTSQDEK